MLSTEETRKNLCLSAFSLFLTSSPSQHRLRDGSRRGACVPKRRTVDGRGSARRHEEEKGFCKRMKQADDDAGISIVPFLFVSCSAFAPSMIFFRVQGYITQRSASFRGDFGVVAVSQKLKNEKFTSTPTSTNPSRTPSKNSILNRPEAPTSAPSPARSGRPGSGPLALPPQRSTPSSWISW